MLDAGQNILTRQLPKTGQLTMYLPGDGGEYETGWWRGRLNANNRTRFIQRTIAGDDIVLDRATGLMWPKDFSGVGGFGGLIMNWNAVTWALALNFAGFTDWRLPNVQELFSLMNYETGPPYIWPPFINVGGARGTYWSSTTSPVLITNAITVEFGINDIGSSLKTNSHFVVAVRKGV